MRQKKLRNQRCFHRRLWMFLIQNSKCKQIIAVSQSYFDPSVFTFWFDQWNCVSVDNILSLFFFWSICLLSKNVKIIRIFLLNEKRLIWNLYFKVRQSNSAKAHELFEDINHPITEVDTTCENKNCRSAEKMAVVWCFSRECTTYNGNRPVRLCSQCNKIRHNTRRGADHVRNIWIWISRNFWE